MLHKGMFAYWHVTIKLSQNVITGCYQMTKFWFLCYHLGVTVKKTLPFEGNFWILALALFNPDWITLSGHNGRPHRGCGHLPFAFDASTFAWPWNHRYRAPSWMDLLLVSLSVSRQHCRWNNALGREAVLCVRLSCVVFVRKRQKDLKGSPRLDWTTDDFEAE